MSEYKCSHCGAAAYYDGRCGDGPVLMCECVSQKNTKWIDDGRGGYTVNRYNAKPVKADEYDVSDPFWNQDPWSNDRR